MVLALTIPIMAAFYFILLY